MRTMPQIYPKAVSPALESQDGPRASTGSSASPRLAELEERVLDYWQQDGTFQASIDARAAGVDGSNEFVFYDGPPFANGLPHYGHLLTGYAKDLVARYQTQRGHRVERRFGWDTHGLPAELEAMKQLGMTDKQQILAMGIDKFNDASRASVMKYADQWRDYVTRQARWVDFDNDYKTLNPEYMESVLWAFKTLHQKGLTYSGYRVLPYCWNDETPLSNHELRMDEDVYQDRQDQTVTVSFPLRVGTTELSQQLAGVEALAWTTTPWTLPTNAALAVGPGITYVVVDAERDHATRRYLIAEDLLGNYAKDLGFADAAAAREAITSRHLGSELEGLTYEPLWDYLADPEEGGYRNAFRILVADYVTTTDGTGLVHQAPAYGEEDQAVCEQAGIQVILSVDEKARFLPLFSRGPLAEIAGLQVFEANRVITRVLKAGERLIRQSSYVHSYPHCWRCRNPLIYRAVSSWYVEVTKIRDRMVELNQDITWIPGNVKDGQFGTWLSNARDWSISRNRFWGSPIPVWQSDDPEYPRTDVYGSLAELQADFGRLPVNHEGEVDLHRPFIDELTRPNPDDPTGRSTMRRVEDVLDVWFDSGSMPYAQVHYPFENEQWFETHHPADFIVEYIGQTRGWFYMLHILSTALFDRPAFRNVISHGIVLGSDGQKMSKSLKNYPDVSEVFDRDGSDAMRWFLMASPILRGGNLVVTEQGIRDGVRQVILPLWNVWHFFALYTNAAFDGAGYEARTVTPEAAASLAEPIDRYILANTGNLVRDLTEALDAFTISEACESLRRYLDTLTNWYVRRSRQRFFDEDTDAFDVLYTCLETVCRVAAPLLPLVTEEIWRGLTGCRSVHLTDWPDTTSFPADPELVEQMDRTRQVCSVGSSLRKAANLRVRLPLRELTVVAPGATDLGGQYRSIIADELNLKEVRLVDSADADPSEFGITQRLVVDARAAGPRLGRNVQTAIKASKAGEWHVDGDGGVVVGGLALEPHEYTLDTVVVGNEAESKAVTVLPGGGFLVLDTEVTDELAAEGTARDAIRAVQQARRDADLRISDRISTVIGVAPAQVAALEANAELISAETLTVRLRIIADEDADGDFAITVEKVTVEKQESVHG
ncbi:isoleucine--tRNA ligase [Arthrobacter echini]|uniref:Isoleucine--tRNA ligase n=2 Tax=Arthrobacter echini TaxID=1529066 RepID=A0A5D0XRW2_9MICC|nr:isoleucine--tRNA ligase [Arthrobacter echini]